MKLIPYPHTMALGEAFQANDMKFAFLNPAGDDFQMIHSWVKCREYFNELLMKNHHPEFQYTTTYGFDYRHNEFPLDMSATRIAIKFMDIVQQKTFMKNLHWIHSIDDANNCDRTTVHVIDTVTVIVVASKMWIQKCILTNIFTLALKLAALNIKKYDTKSLRNLKIKEVTPSEVTYVDTLTVPVFNSLLENCTVIAELPSKYVDGAETLRGSGQVHAYSGVMYLKRCMQIALKDNPLKELVKGLKTTFKGQYKTAFIKEAV